MADLSVTAGCGHLQPAQTVEMTDTEETIHIGEDVRAAKEKLEAHVMEIEFKIHRFPAKLRGFGTDMDYIAPSIVAIGPYYHGVPELQAMEEVKRMAVYYFCERLADSPEEVYKKILPVACDVRGCYADADALEGITDDDFAAMMFFDGCFLVQCMYCFFSGKQSPFTSVIRSKGRDSILRDMLLLENQIPWPVLQLLTDINAAELTEIGVKLTPSGTTQFFDMKVERGPLFATLSLAPLLLDDLTACWLVNMAAFEQCTRTLEKGGYPVNSYLSVMAQLMNQDGDVRELHGKRIVHTIFDDNQTLKFFKRLAPRLTEDSSYLDIFEDLHEYKQKRWVWIAIYKFIYKNAKTIATVLSIVGVLVGIFKTLISLKHHHP